MQSYKPRFAVLLALLTASLSAHATITVTDVGRFDFTDNGSSGARELSGLAYNGGSSFSAIGDNDAVVYTLALGINSSTSQITSAAIASSKTTLRSASGATLPGPDREAIAIQNGHFLITNETGPQLEAYYAFTGYQNGPPITAAQPGLEVYSNVRSNKAWESLAVYPTKNTIVLFGNEDALTVDGPEANFTDGAMVRIQAANVLASNSTATAIGQFAYPIDAINGDNLFVSGETSGLVELLVLADNTVLAMERSVGWTGYRIRLYKVNGDTATDISGLSGLDGLTAGADYKPLTKTLLWEQTFAATTNSNFESMTAGPTTEAGLTLVLVADNASGPTLPIVGQLWNANDHSLYSLALNDSSTGGDELTGDITNDGYVGLDDLDVILSRWNQVVLPGSMSDPTVDGYVGLDDLDLVLSNWNQGTPPLGFTAIPEPTTALIFSLFSTYLLHARTH